MRILRVFTQTWSNNYFPFVYRIMIPYLLLVLLTDGLLGYFSYSSMVSTKTESTQVHLTRTLQQMRDNTLYNIRDFNRISDQLFSSTTLQQQLQIQGDSYQVLDVTLAGIIPVLETTTSLSINKLRLYLYADNDQIKEVYDQASEIIKDKSYSLLSLRRIEEKAWYASMISAKEDNIWRQVEGDANFENISLLRKLISFYDFKQQIGYLRLSISKSDLFGSVSSFKLSEGASVRVVEQSTGTIVYAPDSGQSNMARTSKSLTIREPLPQTDWVLEAIVPQADLLKEAVHIRNIMLLVCTLGFIVMAVIGLLVARYFSRKVQKIVSRIQMFEGGQFEKPIQVPGNDEFSRIASAFNAMASNIDELIREVYLRGIQKKEAELNALQAQINPHFLYNTLSSINSLANMGQISELTAMVSGLARFYRLTLNNGNVLLTLFKEIQQVKAYFDIQQIKYSNGFSVSYDIDPDLLEIRIPKLIIQPFVENVLKHAWFDELIHIRISAELRGETAIVRIIDNGVGMTKDVISRIGNTDESLTGYGIRNVDERIRLHFGPEWGVTVFSRLGIGTVVSIAFPIHSQSSSTNGKKEAT